MTGIQAEGDTAMAKHGEWNHIEIPADDLSRARGFYENVFGWNFSEVPGFEDYHLYSGDQAGIGGAIGRRDVTAPHHVRNYVNVDDIDATLPKVTAHGGRIVEPKSEVMGQGSYAVVEDSEGNEFALWQQDHTEA